MKIKGWEKISGITYKDYCMVNPIHNAQQTVYYADVINLITKDKLGLQLEMEEVFQPVDKYNRVREYFTLILKDVPRNIKIQRVVQLIHIKNISSFRQMVEMCIEDYLNEIGENDWANGIINQVQQNGTSIKYTTSIPTFDEFVKMFKNK